MNNMTFEHNIIMPIIASHLAYTKTSDLTGLTETQIKVLATIWCFNMAYKYPDASTIALTLNTKNTSFVYNALKKLSNQNLISYTKIYKQNKHTYTSVFTVTGKGADLIIKFSQIVKSYFLS